MNWKKLGKAVWFAAIVALVAYLGVVGIQYLLNHAKWVFGVIAFGLVVVGVYCWDDECDKRQKELLDKGEAVIVLHSGLSPHIARKLDGFKYCYTLGYLADSTGRGFYRLCRIFEIEFIEPNGEE